MKYKPLPETHNLFFKTIVNHMTWVLNEHGLYTIQVKNSRRTGKILVREQIIFKRYIL